MITPRVIQEKEFTISVRGYKQEEVDLFLDDMTRDFQNQLEECNRLRDEVFFLKEENAELKTNAVYMKSEIEKYKSTETSVVGTLEAAKSLMNDIADSADKRAKIVLKNAEMDADVIRREASESAEKMRDEFEYLRDNLVKFREKYRNLLETELERFDTLAMDLFERTDLSQLRDATIVRTFGDIEE